MRSTNKRKLRASLTELILSSEWFLNSSEFMAAREDLLQDDLDHSGLSIVFTEREINALAFLYSKRIFDKRRLDGCMEILFSTASEDSGCIEHHRLISLVERGCDFTQKTVPETVQSFAQSLAGLNGWKNDEDAFIFYRDDEVVGSKRDGIVQRVSEESLCYLHAPVVLQRCLIAKYRRDNSPLEMIDITKFVSRHLDHDQLTRHLFFCGGNSREILRCILTPDSEMDIGLIDDIDPSFMKKHGPGLMMQFRVHSDFMDEHLLIHTGIPTGSYVGDHSMLLIGVKGSGESKMFLVQNWWRKKQFVQISVTYMKRCIISAGHILCRYSANENSEPVSTGVWKLRRKRRRRGFSVLDLFPWWRHRSGQRPGLATSYCLSWQRHGTGCRRSPIRILPVLPDAFGCWWRPCGVTWDAVPEQSWY